LSHLYLQTNILPRQARDKHVESSKRERVSGAVGISNGGLMAFNFPGPLVSNRAHANCTDSDDGADSERAFSFLLFCVS
jgi:hypothetical protein